MSSIRSLSKELNKARWKTTIKITTDREPDPQNNKKQKAIIKKNFIKNNRNFSSIKRDLAECMSPFEQSQNTSYIKEEVSSTNSLHFDDEMIPIENSLKIVDQSTQNSTQYYDSPIKIQNMRKAEVIDRTELIEKLVDIAD